MNNIVTYAEQMLDTFEKKPFNTVDSLILSWISYLNFPQELGEIREWKGMRFAELFRAEFFDVLFTGLWDEGSSKRLLTAMAASPRYRDMQVMGFLKRLDPVKEKQFAALSFQVLPKLCYVAFRGTDSTLVGWKEDFNLAFQYPVPSQEEALAYLETAAGRCPGSIRVGGHSKGGNLAVYAAAHSSPEVKERILSIYSHDGPGFLEKALKSPEFRSVEGRIDKTVPQSSLIGMLMEQQEDYRVIRSSGFSVWQHDPFSWAVEGDDFCTVEGLTADARYLDRTLNEWIRSISPENRERFVDALYELIRTDNADTFEQLRDSWKSTVPSIARAAANLDPTTRKFLLQTIQSLLSLGFKNIAARQPRTGRIDDSRNSL